MSSSYQVHPQILDGIPALIALVPRRGFGKAVLTHLSQVARIRNFGAYYISDLSHPKPVLSVWSGRISDYWFRHNARNILNDPAIHTQMVEKMRDAPIDGVVVERWHPTKDDSRKAIFDQAGIIERVGIFSRDGKAGCQSFFLRDASDGWLSDQEYRDLCVKLPIIHELIGLRHKIVGSENFQYTAGTSVSSLRERNARGFATLSPREAESCDCLVEGKTVTGTALDLGISVTTVRTLRQRAYRKLGVCSATELMALIVNDTTNV